MTLDDLKEYLTLRLDAEKHHVAYLTMNNELLEAAKAEGMAEICEYVLFALEKINRGE